MISSLGDWFLLMWASIDANKEDADEKMKKFRKKFAYEIVKHMFHQIQCS